MVLLSLPFGGLSLLFSFKEFLERTLTDGSGYWKARFARVDYPKDPAILKNYGHINSLRW